MLHHILLTLSIEVYRPMNVRKNFVLKLISWLSSHSSDRVKILKHIFHEIWCVLMKIITTVHRYYFSKQLYSLDTKIWKSILSLYESKKNYLNMQTTKISSPEERKWNFHFARKYSESLNVWQYHFPLKSLFWL